MAVTDAEGLGWSLAVPGDDLLASRPISVTAFGAGSETWLSADGDVIMTFPFAHTAFKLHWVLDQRQTEDDYLRFVLPLEEGNEKMSDKTFRFSEQPGEYVESHQQLNHRPEGQP